MKKDDVRAGETYYTRVGRFKVRVVVYGIAVSTRPGEKTKFYVRRADNGRDLNPRNAAALHTKEDMMRNAMRHHVGSEQ